MSDETTPEVVGAEEIAQAIDESGNGDNGDYSDDLDWDSIDEYDTSAPDEGESESEEVEEAADSDQSEPEAQAAQEVSEEETPQEEAKAEPELIEVKINGQLEKVSLDELKENYSGKVAYDKKFSELDGEKKALSKQIEGINTYVNELGNTMKNASMLEGVFKIGELNNIGPHQITQALIKELLPEINRRMDLSEDQVELEYNKADLEYNKKLQEKQTADFEKKQSQSELQSQISKVMDSLNVDNEEWNEAVDYLDKNLPRSEELTPEKVGEYIEFKRTESRTVEELNVFENGRYVSDQEVQQALFEVIKTYPEFTSQDLQELLAEEFGAAKQEAAQQKVDAVVERKSPKKETINKQKSSAEPQFEDMDADDWDELL